MTEEASVNISDVDRDDLPEGTNVELSINSRVVCPIAAKVLAHVVTGDRYVKAPTPNEWTNTQIIEVAVGMMIAANTLLSQVGAHVSDMTEAVDDMMDIFIDGVGRKMKEDEGADNSGET